MQCVGLASGGFEVDVAAFVRCDYLCFCGCAELIAIVYIVKHNNISIE